MNFMYLFMFINKRVMLSMCLSEKIKNKHYKLWLKLTQISHFLLLSQILDMTIICELISFNIWKVNNKLSQVYS